MIHFTIGYYANGESKANGVMSENLASHIDYNLTMRPGRAFFVDGKCLNQGYLDKARCDEIEKEIASQVATRDTQPYQ